MRSNYISTIEHITLLSIIHRIAKLTRKIVFTLIMSKINSFSIHSNANDMAIYLNLY